MANTLIDIRAVRKRFGEVEAVAGIDLAVQEGELFGLIGHNGAGKTTLFKMLLGLLPASGGEILIGGQAVRGSGFREVRRGIGYLPESLALYDNLSGSETLRFFARLKGADEHGCSALLGRVGLAAAADKRVRNYSKGMRQRLGFAQALLGSPRLLFLDEPTNGLDPLGILEFYRILQELRSDGVTVLLTSHILAEIQQRVDRLALMRNGQLQALGTVQSLRQAQDLPLTLRLVLAPDASDIEARLRQLLAGLGISEIEFDAGVVRFACARADKMRVLAAVAGLGRAIIDIELHEPSLEDVFLGYSDSTS